MTNLAKHGVLVLRKSLLRGTDAPFVMELPPYRLPTTKAIVMKMVERSWVYLRKAGTVILAVSILMWVISTYPKAGSYQVDQQRAAGRVHVVSVATPSGATDEQDRITRRGVESPCLCPKNDVCPQ